MSFPAKENLIFFETLAKSHNPIDLKDATFGDISLKDAARDNLLELMATYAYKVDFGPNDTSSVTSIFIPFEFDEGAYVGVNLIIDYTNRGGEYLNITIKRARRTHAEAEVNGPLFKKMETDREDEEGAYLAEQGRSNPNAWAEAAHDAKRF
jgi:hypothetical protein